MTQPISGKIDFEKYFSNELTNIFNHIWNNVIDEVNMGDINSDLFLYYTLSEPDCMLFKAVNSFLNTFDIAGLCDEYRNRLNGQMFSGIKQPKYVFSSEFKAILSKANIERVNLGHKLITSDHVLIALIFDGKAANLASKGLSYSRIIRLSKKIHDVTDTLVDNPSPVVPNDMPPSNGAIKFEFLGGQPGDIGPILNMMGLGGGKQEKEKKSTDLPYCTNLNKTLNETIIGRSKEINNVIKVLGRKKCNNAVIVGESGVGKTSVVHGLVNLINSDECPNYLSDKVVYKFNPLDLMGGTQLRGMFEERLNALCNALKKHKNYILFIDDFQNLMGDKQKTEFDFIGGLSEVLKGGDVKVIAACTQEGYRNAFENTEFSKVFQKITVEKPTEQQCLEIINGIRGDYEAFHKVKYDDDAITTAIALSNRYITDKMPPSAVLDLLDEAASKKKFAFMHPEYIVNKKRDLKCLKEEKERLLREDKITDIDNINISITGIYLQIAEMQDEIEQMECLGNISVEDIYESFSEHTGIPVSKLSASEKENIKKIGAILKENVIGQDEAMDEISKVIKRNKVGLFNGNKPIGSFMMIGSTGVGKTLTAKMLAKEIFGDEKYLVRFDMSEYADKTAVNKLIGASAGYVGYDKGGLLTESVKRNKHCVLLIDEIEKADEEVYNLFLQILDEGHLTDNVGYKVDFKNTIIIFTSNIGTKEASQVKSFGFNPNAEIDKKGIITKSLKKKFPPEFINRLDKVVYFNILNNDNFKEIIKIELGKLRRKVEAIGYNFTYTDEVVEKLFEQVKGDKDYGARPIVRIIQNEIENEIADKLLEGEYEEKTVFGCVVKDGKIDIITNNKKEGE